MFNWVFEIGWYRVKYILGVFLALLFGRILVAVIMPAVFPELADLARQGWVVNAIGSVFVLGLWALYQHRGKTGNRQLYFRIYTMAIDVMPMLGLFGTVIGLTRFLPTWVVGNPDTEAVKYSFLATGSSIILSAALMFLNGITRDPESQS